MLYRLKTDELLKKQYQYAGKFQGGAFPTQAVGALFNLKLEVADISAILQLVWWLIANIRLSHWFSMMIRIILRKEVGMRLVRIDVQFFSIVILAGINYLSWELTGKLNYWLIGFGAIYFVLMLADFSFSQKSLTNIHTSYPGTSLVYDTVLSKIVGKKPAVHLWTWIVFEPLLCLGLSAIVFFYLDVTFGLLLAVMSGSLFFKELQTWVYNLHSFTNIDESEKDKQILQAYYSNQHKIDDLTNGSLKPESESVNEARIL